jgi:hypothetical protein
VRLGGFELGQRLLRGFGLAQIPAQDRVHETGLRPETAALCQLDGFVDGGVVGDTVEPEDLVEPQAQQVLEHQLLRAAAGSTRDQPVQGGLPADDTIDQFLAKAAVGGREPGFRQRRFQQILHIIAALGATP